MLSLILPPFFVVISIAVLLYLFFRKLPDVERRERERFGETPTPFFSIGDRLKRFFLGLIERFARSFKLFSLKLHNRLNTLAARARAAKIRVADRIAERKKARALQAELPRFEPRALKKSDATTPDIREASESNREFPKEGAETNVTIQPSSDVERMSRLRRWFGDKRSASDMSPRDSTDSFRTGGDSARALSNEEEELPPLVSPPLQPIPEERVEESAHRRAADIGRKFGSVVRRFRPERKPPIFPAHEVEPTILRKKEQLEDILVERISLNPRDIEAYERLGDYYLEQNNLVDAKECYRQVLKLSPAYRLVKIKIRRLERLLEKERMP